MELAFFVYLISILENVAGFMLFLAFAFGVLAFFTGLFKLMEDAEYGWKLPVIFAIFAMFFGGLRAMMPTEKQGYTIAGAYVTQKIAENKNVQEIGGKVVTLINQKLDEAIGNKPEEEK